MNMIGRHDETSIIINLLKEDRPELLSIIGRRRVGKTFLVKQSLADKIDFSFIGTQFGNTSNQLRKFRDQLDNFAKSTIPTKVPNSWFEAFSHLTIFLQTIKKKKKIVFFDEFPWIASHRSNFLQEFTYWWNNWAANQNILVIICGSSTSWMLKKVINSKGGLHNRITKKIHLQPFTLSETKTYFDSRKISLTYHQLIQLYMVTGGIPYYLDDIQRGRSISQIIDSMCFDKNGLLYNEFSNLYAALFEHAENHIAVIKALSSKWKGLTRNEIIQATKMTNGGGLTRTLEELETSDFIMKILPFGKKKKESLYRLVDEYSLFYLKFIAGKRTHSSSWLTYQSKPEYKIWGGYAFENICIKHKNSILKALKIEGIHTEISSLAVQGNENDKGMQFDMLIDRADQCINLCEIKFYNAEWSMDEKDSVSLLNKKELFRKKTDTKKTLFNTVITVYGLNENTHSRNAVDVEIKGESLFG